MSGATEGSILGPDIWDVSYDSLLRTKIPLETHLFGYAGGDAKLIPSIPWPEWQREESPLILRKES